MLNLCRDNALRGMAGWMHSNGVDIPRAELIEDRWQGLQLFRHLAVQPDHMHRAHSGNGIFWPVILQDGQAIGNWTLAAGKVQTTPVMPDLIGHLPAARQGAGAVGTRSRRRS